MWQTRLKSGDPMSRIRKDGPSTPWKDWLPGGNLHEDRVHVDDPSAQTKLTAALDTHLEEHLRPGRRVIVVCIGSDRSTGDALGPLVGTRLQLMAPPETTVKGTLERPVHAANLHEHLEQLRREPQSPLILAIDACLGRSENVGTVCVKPGPLKPGTGVNKVLPSVGKFHVVGVVNVGGFMEYFVLQNTRLSLVMRLADLIADSLADALSNRWKTTGARQVAAAVDPSVDRKPH